MKIMAIDYGDAHTGIAISDRLERNKYCPFCRKHTVHTETK